MRGPLPGVVVSMVRCYHTSPTRYLYQRFVGWPGFRALDEDTKEANFVGKQQSKKPQYPQVFSRPITKDDIDLKKVHSMDFKLL
jgi:hypothetical protein